MGSTQALQAPQASQRIGQPPLGATPETKSQARSHLIGAEVDFLREENRQLRELVIQLSKIVLEKVVEGY
jgi:hypothetical protein